MDDEVVWRGVLTFVVKNKKVLLKLTHIHRLLRRLLYNRFVLTNQKLLRVHDVYLVDDVVCNRLMMLFWQHWGSWIVA